MPTLRAYWKAKDFGRCVECYANNPEPQYARCGRCRGKRRKQKQQARAMGVCVSCQKTEAVRGSALCESCGKHKREEDKRRYAKLKAAGLCVRCGEIERVQGLVMCALCSRDDKDYNRRVYHERVAAQLCASCGKALPNADHSRCDKCRRLNAVRSMVAYYHESGDKEDAIQS